MVKNEIEKEKKEEEEEEDLSVGGPNRIVGCGGEGGEGEGRSKE